ncbi:hypothetical protein PVAP13_9KG225321 [Panicum virgatum]|uniref:Uncharacterized protein n=1 Tax=Panicum virgatum TaxID=38727 RepID=A0A8T0N761_PANVG|nr:hypothetical protein PVAP13_9KG225321 [Panicum virgatum]
MESGGTEAFACFLGWSRLVEPWRRCEMATFSSQVGNARSLRVCGTRKKTTPCAQRYAKTQLRGARSAMPMCFYCSSSSYRLQAGWLREAQLFVITRTAGSEKQQLRRSGQTCRSQMAPQGQSNQSCSCFHNPYHTRVQVKPNRALRNPKQSRRQCAGVACLQQAQKRQRLISSPTWASGIRPSFRE